MMPPLAERCKDWPTGPRCLVHRPVASPAPSRYRLRGPIVRVMSLRRDARNIAKTVDTLNRFAEKMAPKIGEPTGSGTESFDSDGPECTKAQRIWVREVCKLAVAKGVLAGMPELPDELTLGQAEGLLAALGSPVDELYRMGRDLGQRKGQQAWRASR